MTDREVGPDIGISLPPYKKADGYSFLNVFVRFTQEDAGDPPVDLGVVFAYDNKGTMGARRYVNLEDNLVGPHSTNFIDVSGTDAQYDKEVLMAAHLARLEQKQ